MASSQLLEALRERLARGESVLKLAELCRKYETEAEQVAPFCSREEAAQLAQAHAQGQVRSGLGLAAKGAACRFTHCLLRLAVMLPAI